MNLISTMGNNIECELKKQVNRISIQPNMSELKSMMEYHLGWSGEGSGPEAQGKRIRPILTTLTTAACGSDWTKAIPAAAGIELIHNFFSYPTDF